MENEIPSQHCRNCDAPLPEDARFCPNCSQRNHDGRFTFREFVVEIIASFFNLDNRIFGTLKALPIPGKLTTAYFEGKHVRYYHPLRLFLFTGVALVSIITLRYRQGDSYTKIEKTTAEMQQNNTERNLKIHYDSVRVNYVKELTDASAIAAVDTFSSRIGVLNADTLQMDSSTFNVSVIDGHNKGITIASKDLFELSVDSVLNKYEVKGFLNRLLVSRAMRMMKGMNEYLISMFGNIIWMMLVMMPLLALSLKLLYIRKPYFYYEHLIFSLHVHSVLFLLLFLVMAFFKHPPEWLTLVVLLIAGIYPLFAMKRVYKQSWWKTILKFFLLSIAYLMLAIISFILMAGISLVLF